VRRLFLLAAGALALAGCGDDATVSDGGEPDKPQLVVSAASSMKEALTDCAPGFEDGEARLQFGGSDELAAQIRQGAPVDVFAAASTKLPDTLASEGKLEAPVAFVSNRLVLAVPADGSMVASLEDLEQADVKLVIGAEGVPVGDYTRAVLAQLGPRRSEAILANVRSNEPDVKGVVGKLTQGAADAGFVYVTDVQATDGKLEAIELPGDLDATATYAAGVVTAAREPEAAEAFVDDLLAGGCHDALIAAGFTEP
jgi:molybdate transport system substrate-binding protein